MIFSLEWYPLDEEPGNQEILFTLALTPAEKNFVRMTEIRQLLEKAFIHLPKSIDKIPAVIVDVERRAQRKDE